MFQLVQYSPSCQCMSVIVSAIRYIRCSMLYLVEDILEMLKKAPSGGILCRSPMWNRCKPFLCLDYVTEIVFVRRTFLQFAEDRFVGGMDLWSHAERRTLHISQKKIQDRRRQWSVNRRGVRGVCSFLDSLIRFRSAWRAPRTCSSDLKAEFISEDSTWRSDGLTVWQ